MKTYIIHTNALISFITDRNIAQQEIIADIFKNAARLKKTIFCPQNVLTEFIYVMEKVYEVPKITIQAMIQKFIVLLKDLNLPSGFD